MAKRTIWRVYGSAPAPADLTSERQARRLARRYERLGIRPTVRQVMPETPQQAAERGLEATMDEIVALAEERMRGG